MGARKGEVTEQYQKRMDDEGLLTNLFVGLSLTTVALNPVVAVFGGALWFVELARKRVVKHGDKDRANRTLFLTNPLLELLSVTIAFYSIAIVTGQSVGWFGVSGFSSSVLTYAGLCLLFSLVVLVVEHYLVGEYFAWWGDRALENANGAMDGPWAYVANRAYKISKYQPSNQDKRRVRSRQRRNSDSFTPSNWRHDPPSPELSWLITFGAWFFSAGRTLVFVVGMLLFTTAGYSQSGSLGLTAVVVLTSSLLSDQIKYLYLYWSLRSGDRERPEQNSFGNRLVLAVRSYWVSTLVSFGVLWLIV